tara:strand:+ start:484 stop:747 length:264 start_codon:yes stop_codon:yes gene_type:complete
MSLISITRQFAQKSRIPIYSSINVIEYNSIYLNNHVGLDIFSPLPEDENLKHISYAAPESDFTGPRIEEILELLKKNNTYKIDSKKK